MEYAIRYHDPDGPFVVKTNGPMNAVDFLAMAADLLNHLHWAPGKNVFFDHEDLDFSKVSVVDIQEIRTFHRKNERKIGSGKSAIVLRPGFSVKWDRLWSQGEKIQTRNKTRVFERHDDAMSWLSLFDR